MLWALLRQYARPYRGLLSVVATLQVVSTLASLYLPTVNAAIIDDGVATGDLRTIVELGGVMLAVTALQVVCAVGVVYFGSRAGMGFGRDLRAAIFHHVTGFSAEDTARFGAPSLLTACSDAEPTGPQVPGDTPAPQQNVAHGPFFPECGGISDQEV
ncbi:MAG TPA: ABC transporter transmembrane domain-containing protein, partial [Mycobacterium sp.]|nr:ABC transporter transmembrane domain-containing protein [Mycobacterium sp.]